MIKTTLTNQVSTIVIVEPEGAACIFKTAQASDGKLHSVRDLNTIMAGLSCGEPCTVAWDMIERNAEYAIACPDYIAANGMRILGNPVSGDDRIISGESGAVTIGVIAEIMRSNTDPSMREMLNLGSDSVVLCISTEGDTDQASYRNITWYGEHSAL